MKVIKHWKYGVPPEKPIFTHPSLFFGVDRQTDGRTVYSYPREIPELSKFCCTRRLCLLYSLSRLSRRRGFSAIGRTWQQRVWVSRPFFPNQPLKVSYTENSNGPSGSPGDSHLEGRPELGICLLWALLHCLCSSAFPYSAPLDLLFRSRHTCSASVFSPPGPRPL